MNIISEIALAVLIIVAVISLIWAVQNSLLLPVKCGKGTDLWTLIRVQGDGESLEQTVNGLMWLRNNGKANMHLVIVDCGLSGKGRYTAEIIEKKEENVVLCASDELSDLFRA